jgi:cell division protein FtsA
MFGWGQKELSGKHYLIVLDVGTVVAKALVVYLENNEVCVVGRSYVRQSEDSMRGGMIADIASVSATCKQAIEEACAGLDELPKDLILGVNGQLVEGVTTTLHYDRAHPEHPLEHSELKNIIYKIQQGSAEKLRAALNEKFLNTHPDIQLIHAAVVEVQLDGYVVENPIGFQGKRLTLTVFNAYLPLVYTSILQNLAKLLQLNLVSIATQPYGLSKLLVNVPGDIDINGIFIDIGGRSTDVVIVKNGSVEGMQSFAIGGSAFTGAIKTSLKLTYSQAEKTKLDYSAGTIDKRTAKKIISAIESEAELWRLGVELALREFPETKVLPNTIYLTGGGANLPDIKATLQARGWYNGLSFAGKPAVAVVSSDEVGLVADEMDLEWGAQDLPPLGIAKLTLDLVGKDDIVTTTLQTIVRAMR